MLCVRSYCGHDGEQHGSYMCKATVLTPTEDGGGTFVPCKCEAMLYKSSRLITQRFRGASGQEVIVITGVKPIIP